MKSLILLALCALSIGATRLDLVGQLMSADGRPITGAIACIYTAGMKVGTGSFCPACYADCGKSAVTDAQGEFKILSLDPELKFRLLFVAEGYRPAYVDEVDPVAGNRIEARLQAMPTNIDPARTLKGRVVDSHGDVVVGAMVTAEGCKTADRHWWGSMPGVDAMCITNARGEFLLTSETPAIAFDLKVEARSLATRNFELVPLGGVSHELRLGDGATVLGRVLKDGKPVVGVAIGMVQEDRAPGGFTGARVIGTDEEGRFAFFNVAPSGNWNVYALMNGMKDRGAVVSQAIRVNGENTTSDAGDMVVAPSYKVSGHVVLADGQLIAPNSQIVVSRENARDTQTLALDLAGHFEFTGIPAEEIGLTVSIAGYHLSRENHSLDLLNLTHLVGTVSGDISNITVQLEPGNPEKISASQTSDAGGRILQIRKQPIEGVRR